VLCYRTLKLTADVLLFMTPVPHAHAVSLHTLISLLLASFAFAHVLSLSHVYLDAHNTATYCKQQLFFPGVAIAFWMVGLPASTFAFFMLVEYATAQTAEASLSFISKFTDNAAYAVVASQVCTHPQHNAHMHVCTAAVLMDWLRTRSPSIKRFSCSASGSYTYSTQSLLVVTRPLMLVLSTFLALC
jgi:hypothetical protein